MPKLSTLSAVFAGYALLAATGAAHADDAVTVDPGTTVHVHVDGTVSFNYNTGILSGVKGGAAATMDFNLSSASFVDSTKYPTRGYTVDLSTFTMNIGGQTLTLDPTQAATYFVLRNNDPKVDGFFMSHGPEDQSTMSMYIPGMSQQLQFNFLRTFNGNAGGKIDTTLNSLNILDAVGKYAMNNVSDFEWTIGYQDQVGTEMVPTTLTISAVPEPGSFALLGLGLGAVALCARRRQVTPTQGVCA